MATKDIDRPETKQTPSMWSGWWSHHPLMDLRRQMDELFDEFASGWRKHPAGMPAATAGAMADIRVEVNESEAAYEVVAELPGLEAKDVDVELAENTLTIKGEKSTQREEKEKNCYFSERSYGAFRRSFRLPDNVDQDQIAADFDKGVLKVTLPKTEESRSKPKKIDVKGE